MQRTKKRMRSLKPESSDSSICTISNSSTCTISNSSICTISNSVILVWLCTFFSKLLYRVVYYVMLCSSCVVVRWCSL